MNLKKIPTLKSRKIKVGITIGDPSGIGPALTLKALNKVKGLADFVVIGDNWVLGRACANKCLPLNAKFIDLKNIRHRYFSFGKISAEYGKAAIEYLDKALQMLDKNELDCLVTCPISKQSINLAGFKYSGHTEYLAEKTNTNDVVMMLLNKSLKFSLITRHIPIKDVPLKLDKGAIYKNIKITADALKKFFLIPKPRIAVCGLNPHASDNGLIGIEEDTLINPAIKKIKSNLKLIIEGPLPADSAIQKAAKGKYDAVVAMYHDQALIPLKLTQPNSGVNLTLGLSFIRTSPLHGTAFDIAKKPALINPGSLIEAIKIAIKCSSNLKKD